MESKKINQLATELSPELSDLTIIGDPNTGISKKITLSQMASLFTGTVEEYASLSAFPLVGTADTIYIALDTNILYRWDAGLTSYVELSPNIVTSLVFNDANGFDGTISLVGSTATLTITTALTTGSVGFIGGSGALTQDNSNFFWDNSNKRLGINTNTPTTALDVFGSGIIGRLNGTSTNNAFLGFASAGTNKWSIGNVQSDHRFRIYSEANTSELVSVLQTGEFGIGIANPTTKLHIDGGASALIANLDANVSVAKSISFRSDNSARINLEVSGTESGSNAGADLFIRTYTDAGALLATPITLTRSTGAVTLTGSLTGTNAAFAGTVKSDGVSSEGKFIIERDSVSTNTVIGSLDFTNNNAVTTYGKVFGGRNSAGDGYVALGTGVSNNLYALETGFVGIGTSNPNKQFVVNQTGVAGYFLSGWQSGTEVAYWYYDSTTIQFSSVASSRALTFLTTDTERMRITSGGKVLIGTTTDNGPKVQIAGSDRILELRGAGSGNNSLLRYSDGTTARWSTGYNNTDYIIYSDDTSAYRLLLGSAGLLTIPSLVSTYTTSSGANMYTNPLNGQISRSTSSIKYKKNVENYTKGLDIVMQLRPVSYEGKSEMDAGLTFAGLIAEEVHNLGLTEFVQYAEDGSPDALAYQNMVALLTKAIQEQQAKIEELKALINK